MECSLICSAAVSVRTELAGMVARACRMCLEYTGVD
jgi:hypothetical protein